MSADRAVLTEIDLEEGSATLQTEISISELFGDSDRWVLVEDANGWAGFERDQVDDREIFYWVDTRREGWNSKLVVGPRAILEVARQRVVHVDPFETAMEGSL